MKTSDWLLLALAGGTVYYLYQRNKNNAPVLAPPTNGGTTAQPQPGTITQSTTITNQNLSNSYTTPPATTRPVVDSTAPSGSPDYMQMINEATQG